MTDYRDFLQSKTHEGARHGFTPTFMPPKLFDFQIDLTTWAIEKGRAAIYADCGLGKTPMQLTWAENVHRHTNKPVLILTPLAVSAQTLREADKFGVEAARADDRLSARGINIANYERLHHFDPSDFSGVVLDESSILKSYNGARRQQITQFLRKIPYRLLATATAAPNDYMELGTSSEALGEMGYMDMLGKYFKNDNQNTATRRMYGEAPKWRFKGHAEQPFWRWVTSWARAIRKPSDLGYPDGDFILPPLNEHQHLVDVDPLELGRLFDMPAATLEEQRDESKRSITQRCEHVAQTIPTNDPAIIWCHLDDEATTLNRMITDAVEVSGKHTDAQKEDRLLGFAEGRYRVLITKPRIGAWGLNYQHCNHISYFPSHSYEQYYQAVRRCWRFGQTRPVHVEITLTEGQKKVMANLQRKSVQAAAMFDNLVREMNDSIQHHRVNDHTRSIEVPSWL